MDVQKDKIKEKPETPLTLLLKSPQKTAQPPRSQTPITLPQSVIAPLLPATLSLDARPTITLQ